MTTLVNGEPGTRIDATDRGLQFGDGVFETLRVQQGRPVLWDRHWRRLCQGLDLLGIPRPRESDCLDDLGRACGTGVELAKLIVTRGPGPRGYAVPARVRPTRIVTGGHPLANSESSHILRLGLCGTRVGPNPLPGCKHLNRLENVLARQEWKRGWDEGLMLDSRGRVRCATQSNVFVLAGGRLVTPSVAHHGVAGTRRGWLIDECRAHGLEVHETMLNPMQVLAAPTIFLTNTRIGLRRAVWADRPTRIQDHEPDDVLRLMQNIGAKLNALD